MKKVAIIVVTYNRLELLKECIQSLETQSYQNRDIIIVNNGSTDGTQNWLKTQKDLIVINQDNCGGAGGFYTGIKFSCEEGYEYSWIMDDDVEARPDTLEKLMNKEPFIKGFLCSRVIDLNGKMCNTPHISKNRSASTGELIWGNNLDNGLIEVVGSSFVSVLIPNNICFQIGLPYKEYFIWGDDTEYTHRISNIASSFLVCDSIITHKRKIVAALSIFTETNPQRIKFFYNMYRNRIHLSSGFLRKGFYFVSGIIDSGKLLLRGEIKKARISFMGSLSGLFFRPKRSFPIIGSNHIASTEQNHSA